jgi:argininosuccinate lyase
MKPDDELSTTKGMTNSYNLDSKTQQEDFVESLDTLLECIDDAAVDRTHLYSLPVDIRQSSVKK